VAVAICEGSVVLAAVDRCRLETVPYTVPSWQPLGSRRTTYPPNYDD
jgi:hypothetical protein